MVNKQISTETVGLVLSKACTGVNFKKLNVRPYCTKLECVAPASVFALSPA